MRTIKKMKAYSGLAISFVAFSLTLFSAFQVFSYQAPEIILISPTVVEEKISAPLNNELPTLTAISYLAFNLKTGAVLIKKNEIKVLPIASVTKLFTASVLSDNPNLDATTSINWNDINAEGEAGKLKYGEVYSYRELLFPLLLESSNDAAVALERIDKGKVVDLLNALAKDQKATSTKFSDTSGLSGGNVSTAADLQKLLIYVYINKQPILDITKLPQYLSPKKGWINNNPIYKQEGYQGGKHGYTETANRTDIAIFKETINSNPEIIGYIVLGSSNLKEDIKKLRAFVAVSATKE